MLKNAVFWDVTDGILHSHRRENPKSYTIPNVYYRKETQSHIHGTTQVHSVLS
jgi:hypothetical protein